MAITSQGREFSGTDTTPYARRVSQKSVILKKCGNFSCKKIEKSHA